MNPQLNEKIIEDLKKSGFYAEMQTRKVFTNRKWQVDVDTSFFDRDEQITRTIDLKPILIADSPTLHFENHLCVEVKKSEKPWVVFGLEHDVEILADRWDNPFVAHNMIIDLAQLTPVLAKGSLPVLTKWIGSDVHEAFKSPDSASRWFSAALSAAKAADSYLHHSAFDKKILTAAFKNRAFLCMMNPVVVLEGQLVLATLDTDNECSVRPIRFAPLRREFETENYPRRSYRIDLVMLEHLDEYLEFCENRMLAVWNRINELTPPNEEPSGKEG